MLISPAFAADTAAQPDPIVSFLPMIVIFVVFYFLLIRPQTKRAKETRKMQEALQKGDEVLTASGQAGKIVKISDQYASIEIADGIITVFQRSAIQSVLPKGTLKDLK